MQATVVQSTFKHISNYANILFDLAEWEKALEYLRNRCVPRPHEVF